LSYIDAHTHLADPGYTGHIDTLLEDARQNNVKYLLSNAVDYETSIETIALAKRNSNNVLAAVGVHPLTVTNRTDYSLDKFDKLLAENQEFVAAIGEIGLDGQYSQDQTKRRSQLEVFEFFLGLAQRRRLPVIVHSRLAVDEVLKILPSFDIPKVLLHWYSGPVEKLSLIRDHGYLISVGPSILYSKRTSEIARTADLEMILSETDGPVSYHGPFEGRMTKPSFIIDVVQKLTKLKSKPVENIRDIIQANLGKLLPHTART
jgi:TatD DNase family protein